MANPRNSSEAQAARRPSALGLSIMMALCTLLAVALMAVQLTWWRTDARTAATLVIARATADATSRVDTSSDAGKALVQKGLVELKQKMPEVREALVLEGTEFVAHTTPELAQTRLKRDDLSHKQLYDDRSLLDDYLGRNIEERAKYKELKENPYASSIVRAEPGEVYVAVPVVSKGESRGIVVIRSTLPLFPAGSFGIKLTLMGAGLIVLLWLMVRMVPTFPQAFVGVLFLIALGWAVWTEAETSSTALQRQVGEAATKVFPVWNTLSKEGAALVVTPVEGATGDALPLGLEMGAPDAAAPAPDAAAPAPDAAAPAPDAAAPAAQAAPVAPPEPKAFLEAVNQDGSGNLRNYFASVASPPVPGPKALVQGDVSVEYGSSLAVEQEWTWRGLGLVGGFMLIYLVFMLLGYTRRMSNAFVNHWYAYAYVSPAVIGTVVLVFGPFMFAVILAFYTRAYTTYEFVGLRNFIEILSNFNFGQSKNFYRTLGVTVMWTVINVSLHVSIGLGLAMILKDKALRFTAAYRTLLVLPWALPNYITALIWLNMFNKEYGAVNAFLSYFGVEPISWFSSFGGAFSANLITNVWLGFPFMMVISLGALQSIPADLYEAADVDGANRLDKFWRITLPLLKPALFPAIILGIIWTFNSFNIIYLVSGGGPDNKTDILITEAYRWAFEQEQRGYAAAYSMIIFLILYGYTTVTNRITKSTDGAFS